MIECRVYMVAGHPTRTYVDALPKECPICRRPSSPTVAGGITGGDLATGIQLALHCDQDDCHRLFIAHYRRPQAGAQADGLLVWTEPLYPRRVEFSKPIRSLSRPFCEIYAEAHAAETAGLFHVAGGGYGKALEFLVTDFALQGGSSTREEILSKRLTTRIKQFIGHPEVRELAERAAWLRNDELHYERKHVDSDLHDLKELIDLSVEWIELTLRTRKKTKEIAPK
jgi:hypothetical protein